jgi:hypothetical protein
MTDDTTPVDEPEELSVPDAAASLGVSPGHVQKLIDAGLLPHLAGQPGPRVRKADLAAYRRSVDQRHAFLDALAAEAQKMGLY